jgi:D-alanine-D-alanine ligase
MNVLLLVDAEATLDIRFGSRVTWIEPGMMESFILGSITSAGHSVRVLSASRLPDDLLRELKTHCTDLVFNLTLHWKGDRRRAVEIACLLDELEIPYTGSGPQGILRACDKALSKHLIRSCGFSVPNFVSLEPGDRPEPGQIAFPAIVKPRFEGGSAGITRGARVETDKQLGSRVTWIHRTFGEAAVAEEFIEGREVSVGVFGNEDPIAFPMRERVFPRKKEGGPQFACDRVKTDPSYRDYWGIHWERVDMPAAGAIQKQSLTIFRELQLRDYARMDYRLRPDGQAVFLEANHSPDCSPQSVGMFARWISCDYVTLIEAIMGEALLRCGAKRKAASLIAKAKHLRRLARRAMSLTGQA